MKIACWSGPRNISTALMRSWSSREDTYVTDEPFYSYYLNEKKLKHPMYKEIIDFYPHCYNDIVRNLSSKIPYSKQYWYQKHMAHHMVGIQDFSWLKDFKNCFLIRHPKYVMSSFIKKNTLNSVEELGYLQQLKIIEFLKENNLEFYIVNSDDLLENPEIILKDWCNHLQIKFDKKMLSWNKGPHENDGIWGKHWYDSVYKSDGFLKQSSRNINIKNYQDIYEEALCIYKKIYNFS